MAIAAIAWLGWVSNRTSLYTWWFTADQVARLQQPLIERYRDQSPDSLLLVADDNAGFWQYALQQPFLSVMLGRPNLQVSIVDPFSPTLDGPMPQGQVALDLDLGGTAWDPVTRGSAPSRAELRLVRLMPGETRAGQGFNLQVNGESGLVIAWEGCGRRRWLSSMARRLSRRLGAAPADRYAAPGSVCAARAVSGLSEGW